jgi:hypothetical protein
MEEEVRDILRSAASAEPGHAEHSLGRRLARRFRGHGFDRPVEELRGRVAKPAGEP